MIVDAAFYYYYFFLAPNDALQLCCLFQSTLTTKLQSASASARFNNFMIFFFFATPLMWKRRCMVTENAKASCNATDIYRERAQCNRRGDCEGDRSLGLCPLPVARQGQGGTRPDCYPRGNVATMGVGVFTILLRYPVISLTYYVCVRSAPCHRSFAFTFSFPSHGGSSGTKETLLVTTRT